MLQLQYLAFIDLLWGNKPELVVTARTEMGTYFDLYCRVSVPFAEVTEEKVIEACEKAKKHVYYLLREKLRQARKDVTYLEAVEKELASA